MLAVLDARDNAFQVLFGNSRGREEDTLGRDLAPRLRLQFVRAALDEGDLAPGFAWRGEDEQRTLRTSTDKTRYALPAWFDTVHELIRQLLEGELADTQWVLETLGSKNWLLANEATAAAAAQALQTGLSSMLGCTVDEFGPQTPEQGRLQATSAVRAEVAGRLDGCVRRGRSRLARQILGTRGYNELHDAIYEGANLDVRDHWSYEGTKPSDLIQIAIGRAWRVVLAHYHTHCDEYRALPAKEARLRLRAVLQAECYVSTETRMPAGLVRAPERLV